MPPLGQAGADRCEVALARQSRYTRYFNAGAMPAACVQMGAENVARVNVPPALTELLTIPVAIFPRPNPISG